MSVIKRHLEEVQEERYNRIFYDNLYHIRVHGGLTFSNRYSDFNIFKRSLDSGFDLMLSNDLSERIYKEGHDFLSDYWCIGFDTNHHSDTMITCSKEYVWSETQKLLEYCLDDSNRDIRKWKLNESGRLKLKSIVER